MLKFSSFVLALLLASVEVAHSIAPWPLERQDRWGTGRAVIGPDASTLCSPWISNKLAVGWPVSHGASLGADGMGYFGDWVDDRIYKFNYSTGAVLGSFYTTSFCESVPAISDNNTILCGCDNFVFGVDTSIMDYNWFMGSTNYIGGSVNLGPDGDAAFACSNGKAYRLHPNGGSVWTKTGYGFPHGSMVFTRDDTKVVFANGNNVTALNYADGSLAWQVPLGSVTFGAATAPNGTIIVGTEAGTMYDLDPNTGFIVWSFSTLDHIHSAPAFSPDGTIAYVPSIDHRIYAMRVADGVRMWSYTTSMWCESSPSVDVLGRIYEHNKNGDLYCLSPAGTLIWMVHLNGESRGPMTIGPDNTLYVGFTGNNSASGLAMVRQQPTQPLADGLTMLHGKVASGGVTQAQSSDDTYATLTESLYANPRNRIIQAVLTTHSAFKPIIQVGLNVEARGSLSGWTRQTDLWNFSTKTWTQVGSIPEGTVDTTQSMVLTNAANYADSTGLVKARLTWLPPGAPIVTPFGFAASVDLVGFQIVPKFSP